MRKLIRVVLTTGGSLALFAGVGWLGLQVKPKPFLPSRQDTQQDSSTAELPPPPTRAGRKEPGGHRGRAALQDPDRRGLGQRRVQLLRARVVPYALRSLLRYSQARV